mmetsp:Transcript_35696/g.65487  ORF Transcript_35696/g.65487 Transcript_35696/m.65487 type:complete len:236 (-) Transcript_35696:1114-1821(-)
MILSWPPMLIFCFLKLSTSLLLLSFTRLVRHEVHLTSAVLTALLASNSRKDLCMKSPQFDSAMLRSNISPSQSGWIPTVLMASCREFSERTPATTACLLVSPFSASPLDIMYKVSASSWAIAYRTAFNNLQDAGEGFKASIQDSADLIASSVGDCMPFDHVLTSPVVLLKLINWKDSLVPAMCVCSALFSAALTNVRCSPVGPEVSTMMTGHFPPIFGSNGRSASTCKPSDSCRL